MLQEIKEAAILFAQMLFVGASIIIASLLFAECAQANTVDAKPYYKALIAHEAVNQGLDPAVALAVAEVESTFNPKATGKQGEVGLFQLHPMFHKNPSYDVNKNIQVGVSTLLYWKRNCPYQDEMTYVLCFNRGKRPSVNPKTAPYYKKFIRQYRKHVPITPAPSASGSGFPSFVASDE